MKVLSVAWAVYDMKIQEMAEGCIGGGAGVVIKNICEYIGRKEESFLFIGRTKLSQMKLGHIIVVNSKIDVPSDIQEHIDEMLSAFNKVLEDIKPDIVNVHGAGVLAKKCIELCLKKKINCVYTDHLYVGRVREFDGGDRGFQWDDAILTIPNLNIVAVSTGMRTKILKDYPQIKPEKIITIINGTDFIMEQVQSDFKKQYGLDGYCTLICVGTIISRKNQMQLVRVFQMLSDKLKNNIKIIFCGKDRLDGGLQKEIKKNGLENQLIYVGTFANEDMKKLYSIADGMILPSYAEGLSIAMLEAIAYGMPVIMYADSECAEDLNDDKVVCFSQNRSDEALANAITKWFYTEWDDKYIMEYSKRFSIEKTADEYLKYYNHLLNNDLE